MLFNDSHVLVLFKVVPRSIKKNTFEVCDEQQIAYDINNQFALVRN